MRYSKSRLKNFLSLWSWAQIDFVYQDSSNVACTYRDNHVVRIMAVCDFPLKEFGEGGQNKAVRVETGLVGGHDLHIT